METRVEANNEKMVQLLQSAAGREQGFRMLMQHYGRTLYWHIRRIVISHDDAEDALQETCIKIYSRIVFNMRYYDELSYEEMAHATGKSTGALKANYHYAYAKIKKYMEENA